MISGVFSVSYGWMDTGRAQNTGAGDSVLYWILAPYGTRGAYSKYLVFVRSNSHSIFRTHAPNAQHQ